MKTVVFDFDGVIHSYTSGWKGVAEIPDPPVPGIKEAIDDIRNAGYEVKVVSTRCAQEEGLTAVRQYLINYGIVVDEVCAEKPPALVYIDDRAICFDGKCGELLNKIENFEPWHKKQNELKPCPLCGAEAFIEIIPPHKHFLVDLPDYGGGAFIECPKCSCAVAGKTEQDVIQRWNRRSK